MSLGTVELIAGAAVAVILYLVPAILARRISHGEARFDKNGKLIRDE